jgi:hypothetical protein
MMKPSIRHYPFVGVELVSTLDFGVSEQEAERGVNLG